MKQQPTILLRKLRTGYRDKSRIRIVTDCIDASIRQGELTCLLGSNGSGKSTLLRTLAAFQPPLGGDIELVGKPLRDYSDKALSQTVGIVLTEKTDLRNMRTEDLIGLGRSPYTDFWGRMSQQDQEKVTEAMSKTGILHLRHRMIQTLSDGERQKVMIAKTLAQETPIILLDEPTAFLDFPSKVEVMLMLHRLSREAGKTVFMSTHDLELALQIADIIWLMDPGKSVITGTPEDLALDGSLSGFFTREGIVFDPESGLFRMENACSRTIQLIGDDSLHKLIHKALRRNGILADCHTISETTIESRKNGNQAAFTIRKPGEGPVTVHSITDLLQNI